MSSSDGDCVVSTCLLRRDRAFQLQQSDREYGKGVHTVHMIVISPGSRAQTGVAQARSRKRVRGHGQMTASTGQKPEVSQPTAVRWLETTRMVTMRPTPTGVGDTCAATAGRARGQTPKSLLPPGPTVSGSAPLLRSCTEIVLASGCGNGSNSNSTKRSVGSTHGRNALVPTSTQTHRRHTKNARHIGKAGTTRTPQRRLSTASTKMMMQQTTIVGPCTPCDESRQGAGVDDKATSSSSPCALAQLADSTVSESVDHLFRGDVQSRCTSDVNNTLLTRTQYVNVRRALFTPTAAEGARMDMRALCASLPFVRALGHGQYAYVYASAVRLQQGASVLPVAVKHICDQGVLKQATLPVAADGSVGADGQRMPKLIVDNATQLSSFDKSLAKREITACAISTLLKALRVSPSFTTTYHAYTLKAYAPAPAEEEEEEEGGRSSQDNGRTKYVVGVSIVMEMADRGTLREWIRGKTQAAVAVVYVQVLMALCALGSLDVIHNDLYTRNVLMRSYARDSVVYKTAEGTVLRMPTYGVMPSITDWGMATSVLLGPMPEATCGGHNDPHAMEHDFEVVSTLTPSDCLSMRAANHEPQAVGRIARKAALRACLAKTGTECVHVMLAKELPVWTRDVLALTASVCDNMKAYGIGHTWFSLVMRTLCNSIVQGSFTSPRSLSRFLQHIVSPEFCATHLDGVFTVLQPAAGCGASACPEPLYDIHSMYADTTVHAKVIDMCGRSTDEMLRRCEDSMCDECTT